jgi:glycine cleavage system H lipoate-binding protein
MSNERKNERAALKIAKAILMYPVVVVMGLVVFMAFNVILMPAFTVLQMVRFILDARFRAEVLGKVPSSAGEEEAYYHPGHTWAKIDSPTVSIGMDDFAELLVGKRASGIECADVGSKLKAGDAVWTIHCGDRMLQQVVPMTGTVIEVNTRLLRNPSLMGSLPVGELWVVKMRPVTPIREFRDLFSLDAFRKWNDKVKERILARFCPEPGMAYADGGELIPNLASMLSDDEWNELVAQEFK